MHTLGKKNFSAIVITKNTAVKFIIVAVCLIAATTFFISNMNVDFFKSSINSAIPGAKAASHTEEDKISIKDNIIIFFAGFDLSFPYTVVGASIPTFNQYISEAEKSGTLVYNESGADTTAEDAPPSTPEERFPIADNSLPSENLSVKNHTTYDIDVNTLLNSPVSFDLSGEGPHVLIVHTHASESYTPTNANSYTPSDPSRTEDVNFNMVRVGDELEKELSKRGIKVIHDKTINDYPSYNNSYKNTLSVIESYLNTYPSIQMVFDLHRDSILNSDGTKIKLTADINGEKVSQIMIVCGTNQMRLENDNWQENLKFALKIQNNMENLYPGLARSLDLRQERFNMHATKGSLIFEIGTNGNTLEESVASTKYLAEAIYQTLKPFIK